VRNADFELVFFLLFHIDYGVGIRVLKGEKTGYAYSESTDLKAMQESAIAAAAIAGGTRSEKSIAKIFII